MSFSVLCTLKGPFFRAINDPSIIILSDEDQELSSTLKVLCLECPSSASVKIRGVKMIKGAISNMTTHMMRHHGVDDFAEFKKSLDRSRLNFIASNPHLKNETKSSRDVRVIQNQFDNLIVRFVLDAMVSLRVVEKSSFQELISFKKTVDVK